MPIKHNNTHMLFPTPVFEFEIEDADRLNLLLRQEIAARIGNEEGNNRSNVDGWHSKSDLFQREEPGHRELATTILEAVRNTTIQARGRDAKPAPNLKFACSGWVNVNPPGAYNVPHEHSGAYWSGAYYVTMPPISKASTTEANLKQGAISFIDLRSVPSGQSAVQSPLFRSAVNFRPKEGTILLFPGNARHWVHPQPDGKGDRITIAFNANVVAQS